MRNGPIKDVATVDLPKTLLALDAPRVAGDTRFFGRESVAELQGRIAPAIKALLDDCLRTATKLDPLTSSQRTCGDDTAMTATACLSKLDRWKSGRFSRATNVRRSPVFSWVSAGTF
jgi:hypothetical protein